MNTIITHEENIGTVHYMLYNQSIVKRWDAVERVWVDVTALDSPFQNPGFHDLSITTDGALYVTRQDNRFHWDGIEWVQVTGVGVLNTVSV